MKNKILPLNIKEPSISGRLITYSRLAHLKKEAY